MHTNLPARSPRRRVGCPYLPPDQHAADAKHRHRCDDTPACDRARTRPRSACSRTPNPPSIARNRLRAIAYIAALCCATAAGSLCRRSRPCERHRDHHQVLRSPCTRERDCSRSGARPAGYRVRISAVRTRIPPTRYSRKLCPPTTPRERKAYDSEPTRTLGCSAVQDLATAAATAREHQRPQRELDDERAAHGCRFENTRSARPQAHAITK